MITISLDDIRWQGASVEVHTTFPTPSADGIATLIEGTVDDEGKLVGKIHYGDEEAKAKGKQTLLLPFVGKPIEPSSATPTASSGL